MRFSPIFISIGLLQEVMSYEFLHCHGLTYGMTWMDIWWRGRPMEAQYWAYIIGMKIQSCFNVNLCFAHAGTTSSLDISSLHPPPHCSVWPLEAMYFQV